MKRIAHILSKCRHFQSVGVYYNEHGNPLDVLKWGETPFTVESRPGFEVRVRMIAAALNPSDINMVEGTYGVLPELPYVGGNEGLAVVEEIIGEKVSNLSEGDVVIPIDSRIGGTWIMENIFDEEQLYRIPLDIENEVSVEVATTIKVNPVAAWKMLNDFCELQEGDAIIMNGANSQVGRSALQIAKAMGLTTIGILRDRPNWGEYCEGIYGADLLVKEEEVRTELIGSDFLKENRPKLALNCVGGDSASNLMKALSQSGTMVTYGGMSRKPVVIGTGSLIFKDIALKGFWLDRLTREEKRVGLDGICGLIRKGEFKNELFRKFKFEEELFFQHLEDYFDRKFNDGKMVMIMDEKYL